VVVIRFVVLLLVVFSGMAQAQYPDRATRLIVPFPPGGIADGSARIIAQHLSDAWGKPVVVENRPGAASIVAFTAVVKAAPDGYTLLYANTNIATNPALYANLPYDAERDLMPVALGIVTPGILVVNPASRIKSFGELVATAKQEPGKLTFASVGIGSFPHLALERLKQMAAVELLHVPYKGFGPATTAILANEVDTLALDSTGAIGHVKAGKMRALAATGGRRLAALPDVPTVAELGLAGYEAVGWLGVMAPAGTPREVIAKLNAEINRGVAKPETAARFAAQGVEASGGSPEDFGAFIQRQRAGWSAVIRTGNIKGEQ
jgi:tripartite-type tricarboxylate transporter receptor subunit TctC